jgi:hypothetical protein
MKVFIFESTRAVIKAEGTVRSAGIDCKVIPVPRSISPQCGMALEIPDDKAQTGTRMLTEIGIAVKIFDRDKVKL